MAAGLGLAEPNEFGEAAMLHLLVQFALGVLAVVWALQIGWISLAVYNAGVFKRERNSGFGNITGR
jgi:hypothetical protein